MGGEGARGAFVDLKDQAKDKAGKNRERNISFFSLMKHI
jgi:hypothetical protein